jgi:hypothetical protein
MSNTGPVVPEVSRVKGRARRSSIERIRGRKTLYKCSKRPKSTAIRGRILNGCIVFRQYREKAGIRAAAKQSGRTGHLGLWEKTGTSLQNRLRGWTPPTITRRPMDHVETDNRRSNDTTQAQPPRSGRDRYERSQATPNAKQELRLPRDAGERGTSAAHRRRSWMREGSGAGAGPRRRSRKAEARQGAGFEPRRGSGQREAEE